MKQRFLGWSKVGNRLRQVAAQESSWLNQSQRNSLLAIAERLKRHGVILADEVGMGKTRIAVAVVRAVIESGGRAAILVPPGLGFQWENELRDGKVESAPVLRSLLSYLEPWAPEADQTTPPWFERDVVVVSHLFSNWRLEHNATAWRWALLPTLCAFWRKRCRGRLPQWHNNEAMQDSWVRSAGKSIVDAIPNDKNHAAYCLIEDLCAPIVGRNALSALMYRRGQLFRQSLERAVGLGLGIFDLIVIDEAHKNRGSDSGLTRLIDTVCLHSPYARRLAMTATPVELNVEQWNHSLMRIGVDENRLGVIRPVIQNYSDAVRRVRQYWHSSVECRDRFKVAAVDYQAVLSPFLVRRDKREDESVQRFAYASGGSYDAYRELVEISIDLIALPVQWKRAVCAAESLSVVASLAEDCDAKRLRLTFANGHGLSAIVDTAKLDPDLDKKQIENDAPQDAGNNCEESSDMPRRKCRERVKWWRNCIQNTFAGNKGVLFEHPAILAAVTEIEKHTQRGEKVLVFGRYTLPMRALVQLLNAREMLRCLKDGRSWPQSKIHGADSQDTDETQAVLAAIAQLQPSWDIPYINAVLSDQYRKVEARREQFRGRLLSRLETGFSGAIEVANPRAGAMFAAFRKAVQELGVGGLKGAFAHINRAIMELIGPDRALDASPEDLARAFVALIGAVTDNDEGDVNGDAILNDDEALGLWDVVVDRLDQEFGTSRGGFARLMYGGTSHASRRIIQAGFNRPDSAPRVLVAQSLVGREGLNLHQACRIVVLLHPEWNPGVVEQQIGRVDRVGSHWSCMLDQAVAGNVPADELPRIIVKPIIFRGTYDEHNWGVLMERWSDLRAQLHGVIIPHSLPGGNDEQLVVIKELSDAAPTFSPS